MTFHAKPAIRYFARPALLVLIVSLWCLTILYIVLFAYDLIKQMFTGTNVAEGALVMICTFIFLFLSCFVSTAYFKELHEKCFSKLKVCDYGITWSCIFRRSHTISVSNCRFIGVESEHSFNGADYYFIFFSISPYPQNFSRKIDKLKVSDSFIKFWYTDGLAEYIIAHLPKEKTGGLQYYQNQKKRRRRK